MSVCLIKGATELEEGGVDEDMDGECANQLQSAGATMESSEFSWCELGVAAAHTFIKKYVPVAGFAPPYSRQQKQMKSIITILWKRIVAQQQLLTSHWSICGRHI